MEKIKKLFGGIDLTWKKLIIFAILAGVYTAIMAILPFTKDTSFRDISVQFEWWILFGIIIIANSKSHTDSALKCFVFFLISQPLIYLIQVPFSWQGWNLFSYYKYWFMLTLACLPMGFIGYYIKKKNLLSMIILLPMLLLLAFVGLGYFTSMMESFPHHLLSFILCFVFIVLITLNMLDKNKLKIIALAIVAIAIVTYIFLKGGIASAEYETYKTLDSYNITFEGNIHISDCSEATKGKVEVVTSTNEIHSIKIRGKKDGKYSFTIEDEGKNKYDFEYYYDENEKTIVLERRAINEI